MPVCLVLAVFSLLGSAMSTKASAWDKPWFCHGLDCPKFELQSTHDSFQVREYSEGKWASTTLEGYEYPEAVKKGFMRLFRYIGGKNEGKHKIAMTAPVRVLVHPSDGPFCKSNFTISFFVPEKFQDDPPKPSNEDVYIEHTPAFTAYVISYGGWQTKDKFLEHATQLYSTLEEKGIDVREDMYYTAGYDSPFRLLNRHNEVWLIGKNKAQPDNSPTSEQLTEVRQ